MAQLSLLEYRAPKLITPCMAHVVLYGTELDTWGPLYCHFMKSFYETYVVVAESTADKAICALPVLDSSAFQIQIFSSDARDGFILE